MRPRLTIKLLSFSIHSFHFFGATGYVLGLILGISLCFITGMPLWPILLCGLAGAGVLFGLTYLNKIMTGRGSLVYYHHEIAILACCSIMLYLINLPVLKYIDITLMGIGVFLAFGRIGCFSVGCCHGRLGKAGVKYTEAHVAEGFHRHFTGIPVFPIQLVESACVMVIVIAGSYAIVKNTAPGTALLIYTVVYGAIRFILEYFRGDPERPYWLGFSEAQWTTLGIFAVTVGFSWYGLLPLYASHLWALPGLVLLMLITVATRKTGKVPVFNLLHPKHILEITAGLEMLEKNVVEKEKVLIVTTSENLNISSGSAVTPQGPVLHYTISFKINDDGITKKSITVMNHLTANVLGNLIQILRHPQVEFKVLNDQPGIFHILFSSHESRMI